MVGLIRGDKRRESREPLLMGDFETKRLVDPGADAVTTSARHGVLRRRDQIAINRRRQPLFAFHTLMLTQCYVSATCLHEATERGDGSALPRFVDGLKTLGCSAHFSRSLSSVGLGSAVAT